MIANKDTHKITVTRTVATIKKKAHEIVLKVIGVRRQDTIVMKEADR